MLSHTLEAKEFGIPDTYHFQNLLCRARNLVAKFQYFLLFSRQVYEDHISDGRQCRPSRNDGQLLTVPDCSLSMTHHSMHSHYRCSQSLRPSLQQTSALSGC